VKKLANIRFRSSFESPVALTPNLVGADEGFYWEAISQYWDNSGGVPKIVDIPAALQGSPQIPPPNSLSKRMLQLYIPATGGRNQLNIHLNDSAPVGKEIGYLPIYCFDRWVYFPSTFDLIYLPTNEQGYPTQTWSWFNFWSCREFASSNTTGSTDEYSIGLSISRDFNKLFWRLTNTFYFGYGPSYHWRRFFDNLVVQVPLGRWFRLRVYVNRPARTLKIWIDDAIIFDLHSPEIEMTDGVTPRHYTKAAVNYSEQACLKSEEYSWEDDFIMWDDLPEVLGYACPFCGSLFPTQAELNAHIISAHPEAQFPCPYCGLIFITQAELSTHIIAVHTFVCQFCGLIFATQAALDIHISTVHETPTQPCAIRSATEGTALVGILPVLRLFRDRSLPRNVTREYYELSRYLAPILDRIRNKIIKKGDEQKRK